jgi:hypothetical protein
VDAVSSIVGISIILFAALALLAFAVYFGVLHWPRKIDTSKWEARQLKENANLPDDKRRLYTLRELQRKRELVRQHYASAYAKAKNEAKKAAVEAEGKYVIAKLNRRIADLANEALEEL